jgi:hypothetical protein
MRRWPVSHVQCDNIKIVTIETSKPGTDFVFIVYQRMIPSLGEATWKLVQLSKAVVSARI